MTIWGRKAGYTFLISSIFVGMDIKRYVLQSLILSSKRFVKIYLKTCDLEALKWKKEKTKNQLFSLVFQVQLGYFSLFWKTGFPLNIAWKDGSFDAHNDIF